MLRRQRKGFTLIELLVVIAIIAILGRLLSLSIGPGVVGRVLEPIKATQCPSPEPTA